MKVRINKSVFSKFHPKFKLVLIQVEDLDNESRLQESKHLLKDVENLIRLTFNPNDIKSHHLISPWFAAQELFKGEAEEYHTSVERLIKHVLKKKSIASDNVLTNILRFISLKHIVPYGVDDLKKIKGSLTFSVNKKKKGRIKKLVTDELFYKDDKSILGTKLDYWRNSRTKLKPKSTSALIHFEMVPPISVKLRTEIIKETISLVQSFCGAKTSFDLLGEKKTTTNF